MTRMRTLELRYERILKMQHEDKDRFRPNPRGAEYLTREERYNELRWQIEPELLREYEQS